MLPNDCLAFGNDSLRCGAMTKLKRMASEQVEETLHFLDNEYNMRRMIGMCTVWRERMLEAVEER